MIFINTGNERLFVKPLKSLNVYVENDSRFKEDQKVYDIKRGR